MRSGRLDAVRLAFLARTVRVVAEPPAQERSHVGHALLAPPARPHRAALLHDMGKGTIAELTTIEPAETPAAKARPRRALAPAT